MYLFPCDRDLNGEHLTSRQASEDEKENQYTLAPRLESYSDDICEEVYY